jgi:hypothetical protein
MRGMVLLAIVTSGIYVNLLGCDDEVSRLDLVDPMSDHYEKNKAKMATIRAEEKQKLRNSARSKNTKPSKKT